MYVGAAILWLATSAAFFTAFLFSLFQTRADIRALLMSIAGTLFYICAPYIITEPLRYVLSFREWTLYSLIWVLAFVVAVQILVSDLLSLNAISHGKKEWYAARSDNQFNLVAFAAMLIGWAVILFPVAGSVLAFVFPGFHVFYMLPCC